MKRVFITGGTGLLGLNWAATTRGAQSVTIGLNRRSVRIRGVATKQFSMESLESLLPVLDEIRPDYVVHTAGLTSVEACEANPSLAHLVNVEFSANVAAACALRGVKLAHVSTDHLFPGNVAFVEEHTPVRPINVYGKTKAEGELRVQDLCPDALVIRTNFYGWSPSYRSSFSNWILNSVERKERITLYTDVHYTPIPTGLLVSLVNQLLDQAASGIFHVVGDERVSKYEFGLYLASYFNFNKELIVPGSISDRQDLVRRPRDMSLSNRKVSELLGIKIGTVPEHLGLLIKELEISRELQAL